VVDPTCRTARARRCEYAAEGVSATQVYTHARGEWVTAPENLILAGPIGTGKTHLAIALGIEATRQKRRVLFTRATDLVRQLLEARDARELTRLQQRLRRVEVLITTSSASSRSSARVASCSSI
jgi:DNA replication protein DnaC